MSSSNVSVGSQSGNQAVLQMQLKLNAVRYNVHGTWPYLNPDGIMGPQTQKAIAGFKVYRNIPSTDNNWLLKLDQDYSRVPMLRSAPPLMVKGVDPMAQQMTSGQSAISKTYGVVSDSVKAIYKTESLVSSDEKGLAYVFGKWEEILTQQYEGLLRRLNKFPNRSMRVRTVMRQMERCRKFLEKARRYGIVSATKEFGDKLTKDEAIRTIKELARIISESPLTKGIAALNKILSKVKNIIAPVLKVLNKIPGLKYLSVIEKIVKATKAIIKGNCEQAFTLYMDASRELVEQFLVDAAIGALVAFGGWVALVAALILIIAVFLVDYFFFSDNPGNSIADRYGVRTRNWMMENAPSTYRIIKGNYY